MTNLNSPSGDLPNNIVCYDFQSSTFTVAGGATGGTFAITNSTKTYIINSNVNTATFLSGSGYVGIGALTRCKITSNTTDDTNFRIQFSIDGGTNWTDLATMLLSGANQNNGAYKGFLSGTLGLQTFGAAPTSNQFLVRCAITDGTDPTTDALTITNIRATMMFILVK